MFWDALQLQAGYNAALASVGATLLGAAAGGAGVFLVLRKRALVSDATAHATLPGIALAFLVMTALGGDGRSLAGLLIGATCTAIIGLFVIQWLTSQTRLAEDAAIGAVLSVFFGAGVVGMTIIQSMSVGRQSGLENFLLGSVAGMLFNDALIIAIGGAAAMAVLIILRRPMLSATFDPVFAASQGVRVRSMDLAVMFVATMATVIGLRIVGMVMIVALLIIPAAAARFWTERAVRMVFIAAIFGGAAAYIGVALSASAPKMPTGPLIVLTAFALFAFSMLFAPARGVAAKYWHWRAMQRRAHLRQGLLALARGEPIFDRDTLTVLRRAELIRADGVTTDRGRAQAARALRDEKRWETARAVYQDDRIYGRYDGLTPIEDLLTTDEINYIDQRLTPPREIS